MVLLPSTRCIYKDIGMTPLEAIRAFVQKHPHYASATIGYAGRLDPMAKGLLLLLIGDENKKKHQYEQWRKTYEVTCIAGVSTDTYDLLGMITRFASVRDRHWLDDTIKENVTFYNGNITLRIPLFSAYRVKGKPLYWWARHHPPSNIPIPSQSVTIYECTIQTKENLLSHTLLQYIESTIPAIKGDFRQSDILKKWKEYFTYHAPASFPQYMLRIRASAGTYMRGIIQSLETQCDFPLVCTAIERTQIGPYIKTDE